MYANILAARPDFARFFTGTDMPAQHAKLGKALGLVVGALDMPEKLMAALRGLGRHHAHMPIGDEEFGVVGGALLKTLRDASGDAWSDDTEASWAAAYGVVAGTMLAEMNALRAAA